ncbi:hypothetical protein O3P69_004272 [Scylla paramamosain]|uniref:Wiskott-Aldrich syndrome protein family member n=1 Tax=Scylla paramamosain TaxID=85552 RepID=A0AAW0UH05_SCYPA
MPLVKREVSPVRLAARPSCWGTADSGEEVTLRGEYDLTAVTNVTLCGALRQLASLVTAAQDVSQELQEELGKISNRSSSLAARLAALESRVAAHNPRAVPVPEGDLRSFSERQDHYHHTDQATADLFTETSRPPALRSLYDKAHQTPVHIMREIDQLRDDGIRSSRYFLCEPVLGDSLKKEKLRKLNLDIETRRPASFVALREWCSDDETLTEVCLSPVSPSVPARVCPPQKEPAAHKLPSPEQRVLALSLKYPPELVPIDVSGSGFKRLEKFRQSLVHFEYYKGKHRRKRVKRRNTIADTRDVQIALADREAASTSSGRGRSSPRSGSPSSRGGVSFTDRSFDTTETLDTTSNTTKTSSERENHPLSLGIEVCVPALPRNAHTVSRRMARENTFRENELTDKEGAGSSGGNPAPVVGSRQALAPHISEIVKNSKRDTTAEKQRSHLPILTHSPAMNIAVKLREGTKDECTRSSSGNWSASSSTRTSVESDQHRPLASPTSSYEQDSIPSESLHVRSSSPSSNLRTNSRTTDDLPSTSSHTSDGTLTPTQDIQDIPFLDDDTGSAYSCDTEGYYTSFHIDSGIRSVSYEGNKLAESEYELFGKGSTGTTNSSASIGTVVMRNPEKKTPPKPPQRVSSLERKQENRESVITVIHVNGSTSSREDVAAELPDKTSSQDGDSKSSRDGDSGRETSSSPTEPTSPRQPSLPSPEMECSESDLEADRQEILRVKTTINSSRIPSMCVITPPQSDDESVRSGNIPLSRESSGSQIDNQGQQAPPQGLLGSLVSQGQSHGVTAKMLSFQNSGAKSGGARSVGAISGGKSAVDDSTSEKDSGGKVPVVSHGYTPTLTVIPRGKDGDINAHLKGIMHTAAVSAPSRPDPDQPVLIRPSLHLEHQAVYSTLHCHLLLPPLLILKHQHCLIQWHKDPSSPFHIQQHMYFTTDINIYSKFSSPFPPANNIAFQTPFIIITTVSSTIFNTTTFSASCSISSSSFVTASSFSYITASLSTPSTVFFTPHISASCSSFTTTTSYTRITTSSSSSRTTSLSSSSTISNNTAITDSSGTTSPPPPTASVIIAFTTSHSFNTTSPNTFTTTSSVITSSSNTSNTASPSTVIPVTLNTNAYILSNVVRCITTICFTFI